MKQYLRLVTTATPQVNGAAASVYLLSKQTDQTDKLHFSSTEGMLWVNGVAYGNVKLGTVTGTSTAVLTIGDPNKNNTTDKGVQTLTFSLSGHTHSYSSNTHTHTVTINGSDKSIPSSGKVDLGNYIETSGGTIASANFAPLTIRRNHTSNMAGIGFAHYSSGTTQEMLGYLAIGTKDSKFKRYKSDASTSYDILDSSDTYAAKSDDTAVSVTCGSDATIATINGKAVKINVANPDHDVKVSVVRVAPTSATSYYPTFHTSSPTTAAATTLTNNPYYYITVLEGVANTEGYVKLTLGNSTAKSAAGNSRGYIYLYAQNAKYGLFQMTAEPSDNQTFTFATGGTVLTSGNSSVSESNSVVTVKINGTSKTVSSSGHTHSYLPLSGGTMTGAITLKGLNAGAIAENSDYDTIDDGIWHSSTDGNSQTISNAPTATSQVLFKFTPFSNGTDIRTTYLVLDAHGKAFLRGSRETNSPWHTILHSGNSSISEANNAVAIKINGTTKNAAGTSHTHAVTVDGVKSTANAPSIQHYASCSTAAATAAKTATIAGFVLAAGAVVYIKFTNTNSAADPTLNINDGTNNTGAKSIFYNGAKITGTTNPWKANHTYQLVYDGTQYQLVGDLNTNTTYTLAWGTQTNGFWPLNIQGTTKNVVCSDYDIWDTLA